MRKPYQWHHYRRRAPKGGRGWWIGFVRLLMSSRSRPEAIALGFSIGLVVGFLPLIGLQMALAALLAALLKANPAIAMIPVWVTNPATIMPIYLFCYRIGTLWVDGPAEGRVQAQLALIFRKLDRHALYDIPSQLRDWALIGRDIFLPLLIGGSLVGLLAGLAAYPVMLRVVRRYRLRRERARHLRREKQALRLLRYRAPTVAAQPPGSPQAVIAREEHANRLRDAASVKRD